MDIGTIHLRSDDSALLAEFRLEPGTHARIGSSEEAEISLPLEGLAEIAGTIGRLPSGHLYLADAELGFIRRLDPPAVLNFHPYRFVVFLPSPIHQPIFLKRKKLADPRTAFWVGMGLVGIAAFIGGILLLQSARNSHAAKHNLPPANAVQSSTTESGKQSPLSGAKP